MYHSGRRSYRADCKQERYDGYASSAQRPVLVDHDTRRISHRSPERTYEGHERYGQSVRSEAAMRPLQDNDAEDHEGELALKVALAPNDDDRSRSQSKPHSPVQGSSQSRTPQHELPLSQRSSRQRLVDERGHKRRSRSRSRSHERREEAFDNRGKNKFNQMKRF